MQNDGRIAAGCILSSCTVEEAALPFPAMQTSTWRPLQAPIYDIPHGKQSLQLSRRWRRSRCLTSPRAKGLQSSLSEALFPLEVNSSSSYTHGGGLLFPKQDLWVMKGAGEAAGTSPASAGSRQAQHRAHIYKSSGPTWPFSSRI